MPLKQREIVNKETLDRLTSLTNTDANITTLSETLAAGQTYTSGSELRMQSDVGVFFRSTQAGTLKFQFSPNNSDWSTFPVNGFTIAANIWEFHTAVKLPRYFRYTYQNTSGSTATFNAYVYYGTFRQGSAPLNQSIGDDSDALIVRSVGVGVEPSGTYSNAKLGGSAFRTTTNLGGSTLTVSMTDTTPSTIKVTDATSFDTSGYIYIGSEFLQFANKSGNNLDIVARGLYGTDASSHSIADTVGEAYDSGLLLLDGYTQVATKYKSSNTAQLRFQWYTDSTASQTLRTLAPQYNVPDLYDFLSAPNFGPYVRYVWGNTVSMGTSDFYFETDFTTQPISAQILTLDSGLFGSMTSNLGRNIIAGKTGAGSYINAGITDDGELFTNTLASDRQTQATYAAGTLTGKTYVVLVDLSAQINTGHASLDNIAITCNFTTNNSSSTIKIGVITRVDGTNADISYLITAPFSAANANTFLSYINNFQPSAARFEVDSGVLVRAFTNDTETTTGVNTGATLASPNGVVTPAVGDIVISFGHTGNDYNANVSCVYHTD